MSGIRQSLVNRTFVAMLVALGADLGSLLAIFSFVAATGTSIETGLALFVLSTILMVLGYMLGIVLVGFLAVFVLAGFWTRTRKIRVSPKK